MTTCHCSFLGMFYLIVSQMSTVPLIQGSIINIINILRANLKSTTVYSLKVCICLYLCVVCVCVCLCGICVSYVMCAVATGKHLGVNCLLVPCEYRRQKIRMVVSLGCTFTGCAVLIAFYC